MKAPKLKLFLGLRGRFVVLIAGGIIFSAATVGFYLTQKIGSVYLEGLTTRAVQTARNLANHAEIATLVEDEEEIARLVNGVLVDTQIVFARVYSDDNILLYHAGERISFLDNSIDSVDPISKLSPSSISIRIEDHVHGGHEIISIFAPIKTWQSNIDRERLGAVYSGSTKLDKGEWIIIGEVVIGVNKEGVNDVIRRARLTAGLLTLFVIVLAIAVTVLFVKVIIKPIKRLVMVTNEISRGNLERKLDFRRNDEIGALAESFDRMVDSLQLYKSEVEEYQETLQQKIIERTSDLAETQEQLFQSEKMKAIGQLAAGVAHELNNPLAGILGYSQFALEKLRGKNPNNLSLDEIESFRRYLGDIEAQARRCKRIVQGLLKFSRSSRTTGSTEFDLNTVLKETVELLESQIEMQQLRL
ncbi:MAG: HAMP domain-containing protein, partial [candidate division Zixibacteria bacterium]|nr:HAMP domain-containing protein [candidate division Zixibacteria bacterium]